MDDRYPLSCYKIRKEGNSMVRVNGQEVDAVGKNIEEMLLEQGFEKGRVAVERNEESYPKRPIKR